MPCIKKVELKKRSKKKLVDHLVSETGNQSRKTLFRLFGGRANQTLVLTDVNEKKITLTFSKGNLCAAVDEK